LSLTSKWQRRRTLTYRGGPNFSELNEAPRSKSPTRQSRYGDGALQGILAKANKNKKSIAELKTRVEIA
jgi:hypothetical protein